MCVAVEREDEGKTHSALDGSEGEHVLGSVAAVAAPGLVARVVSLLQDKLLALELGVLITNPTEGQRQRHTVLRLTCAKSKENEN